MYEPNSEETNEEADSKPQPKLQRLLTTDMASCTCFKSHRLHITIQSHLTLASLASAFSFRFNVFNRAAYLHRSIIRTGTTLYTGTWCTDVLFYIFIQL